MHKDDLAKLVDGVNETRRHVLLERTDSYADEDDAISNFKRIAAIWNNLHPVVPLKPSDIAEILSILKQVRVAQRTMTAEQIADSNVDWHNYLDLRAACVADEEEATKET